VLYGALALVGGVTSVFWTLWPLAASWHVLLLVPALGAVLWRFVVREERRSQAAETATPAPAGYPVQTGQPRRKAA
jgi:uncharacterized membrane protein